MKETAKEAREALETTFDPHFKCKDLAERWGMSEGTVFSLFVDEPGVIKLSNRNLHARHKTTVFVPLSIAKRVYESLRNKK